MTEASGTTGEDARHILDIATAADRLDVDPATGLTHDEATHRLDRRGPNRLAVAATRSPWLCSSTSSETSSPWS